MRRHLLILVTLLIAAFCSAQTKLRQEEIYLGAQAGVLASMVQFNPSIDQNVLHCYLGPTAGLTLRYVGHKVCGFQLEVNYMQRGWQEYSSTDGLGYRRQLDYIEVPFMTHLYFGKKARGFINLGPQIGYLVHESQQNIPSLYTGAWESGLGSGTYHQYVPIENKFDWGVAAGLGFYYRSRYAGTYQLEARFNYSLGSMFSTSKMDYFAISANMNLGVHFAYMWQLRGEK